MARAFIEDEKVKLTWNLPRLLLPKNRVKLLLNMLIIAGQAIPRGGTLTVDPVGSGEDMAFQITATGTPCPGAAGDSGASGRRERREAVDAHAIQPFYTGMLARSCGLTVTLARGRRQRVIAPRCLSAAGERTK